MIKVAKFGGTSLADANQFKKVKDIIMNDTTIKYIVASAPGCSHLYNNKITDLLYLCYDNRKNNKPYTKKFDNISQRFVEIVRELNINLNITDELNKILLDLENDCTLDYFVSRGEYLNSLILSVYLGYTFIDAKDIIKFNSDGYLNNKETYRNADILIDKDINAVIPGFYGSYANGEIKTFSRGGSDISGSIVAKAVNADMYENWTDVSGFLMADPKIIIHPKKIDILTYKELRELSYMGATVLHDEAIFPAREANIPINIRNTNKPSDSGTLIVDEINDKEDKNEITGISGRKDYTIFTINKENMAASVGSIKRALEIFESMKIGVEHVPTGIDKFSIVVSTKSIKDKKKEICDLLKDRCNAETVSVAQNIALVSTVGRHIKNKSSIFRRLFLALEKEQIDIKMICQGLSDINIIIAVDNEDFEESISSIYREFV